MSKDKRYDTHDVKVNVSTPPDGPEFTGRKLSMGPNAQEYVKVTVSAPCDGTEAMAQLAKATRYKGERDELVENDPTALDSMRNLVCLGVLSANKAADLLGISLGELCKDGAIPDNAWICEQSPNELRAENRDLAKQCEGWKHIARQLEDLSAQRLARVDELIAENNALEREAKQCRSAFKTVDDDNDALMAEISKLKQSEQPYRWPLVDGKDWCGEWRCSNCGGRQTEVEAPGCRCEREPSGDSCCDCLFSHIDYDTRCRRNAPSG